MACEKRKHCWQLPLAKETNIKTGICMCAMMIRTNRADIGSSRTAKLDGCFGVETLTVPCLVACSRHGT